MKKKIFWWLFGIIYFFAIFTPLLKLFSSEKNKANNNITGRNDGWVETPMYIQ